MTQQDAYRLIRRYAKRADVMTRVGNYSCEPQASPTICGPR